MSKKVLIAIIAIVVVLGGGGAAAYFLVTNTPKNKYLLSEQQSIDAIDNYFTNRFESEMDMQNALVDNSYDTKVTLGADVSEEMAENLGIPASMINASKIIFGAKHDPKAQVSTIYMNPTIADSEIGEMSWSADKNNQYITAPILPKPLLFKNDEIIAGLEKLSDEKMDSQFTSEITNDTLNLNTILSSAVSKTDMDKIMDHYLKFIIDHIDEDKFKKGSGQVTILGDKKKLDNVTLTLSKSDVKKLVIAVAEEAKQDKDVENLVVKSSPGLDYKKELDDLIKTLKDSNDFPSFKSVIHVDGKDIQKRDLTITSSEDEVFIVTLDTMIDKDMQIKAAFGDNKENKEALVIEGSSKGTKDVVDNYTATFNDDIEKIVVKFDNKETIKDKTRTDNMTFDIGDGSDTMFKANYTQDLLTDAKNNMQKSTGTVVFEVEGQEVKLLLDTETKIKADVKVDVKDAQDVNKMSKAEINKLQSNVTEKVTELFMGIAGGF
ncbi:DUF6583 family protein [Kurthia sibirica]|uniref:Uncharacterized protein n=1 Tax=Kurthia sibirica TaxID=202750 RepID=A0A2U3AKU6_9BACL|nr:DUF6583 family protein [Kurthia sibirica]PWI25155.1 hypothetical protein DEX24_09470 [Kurthia sibirica]GEK33241.1 hypothetical protein KSI01_07740 [Kurthia sibirica]